jgi:transposase-like protein
MMAERGIEVAHTTTLRWVIRYVPEFEKRWRRYARRIGSSWRVDETYLCIRGRWRYLYRAVDKQGKTVNFLLRPDRGIAAAQASFRKALATNPTPVAEEGDSGWSRAESLRSCKYLNNIFEQDHRVIKRRCASMTGFKSFASASITISGIELAHRIHKRQYSFGPGRRRRGWSLKQQWERALA